MFSSNARHWKNLEESKKARNERFVGLSPKTNHKHACPVPHPYHSVVQQKRVLVELPPPSSPPFSFYPRYGVSERFQRSARKFPWDHRRRWEALFP
mmetsp:Transcript_28202/g.45397  ORF Transcript_28202/g.45397 Transcript_28202/m.45397 type:complete len:96 (+) Transcript_28202:404-691(+)